MKTRIFSKIMAIVLLCSGIATADRPLERAELLQIFGQLTAQPRKTWISAGTIEAEHQEYRAAAVTDENEINRQVIAEIRRYRNDTNKRELTEEMQKMRLDATPFNIRYELSNEYTMNSIVLLKFDGNRFYWEINVDSRSDSVQPARELADNAMTEQFDLNINKRRIFAWDGQKFTSYFLPGNNVIVNEGDNSPHSVNGPLTAGIIPWGYGRYTYDNLCTLESSAVETTVDGDTQIILTLNQANGNVTKFTLDPLKNYAVKNSLTEKTDGSTISRQYSDYTLIAGNWVPKTIIIEQFEAGSGRLTARDVWNLTSIDDTVPQTGDFNVAYEPDAVIEHFSAAGAKSAIYRQSSDTDTKRLLRKHLEITESATTNIRNCATIATGYVASEFGATLSDADLASMVNQAAGTSNMSDMKFYLEGSGLYCRMVKTDIDTLKKLNGCKTILYYPGRKHFVVVDHIDDRYIWTIDLSKGKFFDRTEISFFDMDWTDGTALLVSKQPIQGDFNEISSDQAINIVGGGGYSCTRLFQIQSTVPCSQDANLCGGKQYEYSTRYGCEAADSGSCSSTRMLKFMTSPCAQNTEYPEFCDATGPWTSYFMMACM